MREFLPFLALLVFFLLAFVNLILAMARARGAEKRAKEWEALAHKWEGIAMERKKNSETFEKCFNDAMMMRREHAQ